MASINALHSPDLQWQVLRAGHGHSFLVKRNGVTLSSEPCNLNNTHSYKFSGLVNPRAVGVALSADRKRVELQLKRGKAANASAPAKQTETVALNKHTRSGKSRGARTIRALTEKSFLRADLAPFAITRYHKLRQATTVGAKKNARRANRK